MTTATQDPPARASAGIVLSRQNPVGETRALLCSVAAVVLMLLSQPIPFRMARTRRGNPTRVGRGSSRLEESSWLRRSLWRRSRRPARRSASLERPGAIARPTDRTGVPGSARPDAAGRVSRGRRQQDMPGPLAQSGRPQPSEPPQLSERPQLSEPPQPSEAPQPNEVPQPSGWKQPSGPLGQALTRIPRPGRAARLRGEMEEGVPEVVDVLRATVAAGINPRRALQAAAEGAPPALEAVLGQAIRGAELGEGAGRALAIAAKGEQLYELVLAGEALDLAETTGAPPGPVLAGVAVAAADRIRSRRAMMAATAQARLSARVVAAMAPAFLGVLALTSPSDAAFLVLEPLGWGALATAVILESLGICWAARIVRGPAP
jgi:Type II secretion system (T2SS), protein F